MPAVTTTRPREGVVERLVEIIVIGLLAATAAALALAVALPLLPGLALVYAVLATVRAPRAPTGGGVALTVALWAGSLAGQALLAGTPLWGLWDALSRSLLEATLAYAAGQVDTAVTLAVERRLDAVDWPTLATRWLVTADQLARLPDRTDDQPVSGLTARKRLTAITALPKRGKTFAYFGLLRARQDGGEWFGRRCRPGRTLTMSEEDRETFSGKVKTFGIRGETLVCVHAPEMDGRWFTREWWERLVTDRAKQAHDEGCDTLDVDTLTTWAPWAFNGVEPMSYCLRTLKAAVGRYGLAGVVILHDRKAGGEAALRQLGTVGGPAAYDVLAGFDREKASGRCTLEVDGRLGEWSQTAILRDGRYVPVEQAAGPADDGDRATAVAEDAEDTDGADDLEGNPPAEPDDRMIVLPDGTRCYVPAPLRPVVAAMRTNGGGATAAQVMATTSLGKTRATEALRQLAAMGLAVTPPERGRKGAPGVYRLASDGTPVP